MSKEQSEQVKMKCLAGWVSEEGLKNDPNISEHLVYGLCTVDVLP